MFIEVFDQVYKINNEKAALLLEHAEQLLESLDEVFVIDNGGSVEIDLTSRYFELNLISFSRYLLKLPYDYTDADARRRLLEIADQIEPPKVSAKEWKYERYQLKPHVQNEARAYLIELIAKLRAQFALS